MYKRQDESRHISVVVWNSDDEGYKQPSPPNSSPHWIKEPLNSNAILLPVDQPLLAIPFQRFASSSETLHLFKLARHASEDQVFNYIFEEKKGMANVHRAQVTGDALDMFFKSDEVLAHFKHIFSPASRFEHLSLIHI